MSSRRIILAAVAVLVATPLAGSTGELPDESIWGRICSFSTGHAAWPASWSRSRHPTVPVATCPPPPTGYNSLPSIGDGSDTTANLAIGYDADTDRLCFVATGLPQAPVLRVGVGDTLSIQIQNTLQDTDAPGQRNVNCPIDSFGGEGLCEPKPVFPEAPGPDGPFYPLEANEAHSADGTSNLHVHGLFVSPMPCSDEVLKSAIYPTNWEGPVAPLQPCQATPDTLTYTYQLPADHPAGVYWYHTHRHGQAEHQTQMGLVGAIVVEDAGDAWRSSIGVSDEVLLVTDTPITACIVGPNCDARVSPGQTRRQSDAQAARAAARNASPAGTPAPPISIVPVQPVLDPRVDQVDQAGECAYGASNNQGGVELWTLLLNGAPVPEAQNGFPPDSQLLTKTMQPAQRQLFRLVNASANSFVAPELVLSQNGVETVEPLEVFARDGVGLADAQGTRHFGYFDVADNQFIVPPASRVEFVVHAPPIGATLYLQSSQVDPGCGGNAYPARRLLLINSAGTPVNPGPPDDSDLLKHTPSLAPYLSTLGTTATVHRTFVLAEYGRGFTYGVTDWKKQTPTASDYDASQTDFYLTEVASDDGTFDPNRTVMKPFNGHNLAPQVVVHLHGQPSVTEEWLVENSTLEIHAFHMHQIHFRDVTAPNTNPDLNPILDVITLPAAPLIGDVATGYPGPPGYVRLRMTFTTADIGEFVFHCHILEHEDNGMMAKVQVVAD
jgi:FtsP/CotA-like multicopper oxidase with cupredoxin domain